jgi:hypothetical protein
MLSSRAAIQVPDLRAWKNSHAMGRFDDLSDLDFEELVADLFSVHLRKDFRSFARGPDKGVDLRARARGDRWHIIQCKHFANSSFSQLKAAAAKEAARLGEAPLRMASYRFVTSRRLTVKQTDELAHIFEGYVRGAEQIYGDADVRRLLAQHPDVENRHVKLWLPSAASLQRTLRSGAYERSEALLAEIRAGLPRYVQTNAFSQARAILHEHRVCVIAGPPGVGKTTLAQLLLLDGLDDGFQPFELDLERGIGEAFDLIIPDTRQLFFFDDFLGRIALFEAVARNDSLLLRFVAKVARTPDLRLVLTTREYVLQQAKDVSDRLESDDRAEHKYLLSLDKYTRVERARILYNHLFFAPAIGLPEIESLAQRRGYLRIVDHRNFSPRLIDTMTRTAQSRLGDSVDEDFLDRCLRTLDHPFGVWQRAFDQGIDVAAQAVLLGLIAVPDRIAEEDLELVFASVCAARKVQATGQAFYRTLRILDDTFIRIARSEERATRTIDLMNPSVVEFLVGYLTRSLTDARVAIVGAYFFEQVRWYWGAFSSDHGPPHEELAEVFAAAFERCFERRLSYRWGLRLPVRPPLVFPDEDSQQARLEFFVECCGALPTLPATATGWISRQVVALTSEFDKLSSPPRPRRLKLFGDLASLIGADVATRGQLWKTEITAMPVDDRYFDSLATLWLHVPGSLTRDEWTDVQRDFELYLEPLLSDPADHFDEVSELENLDTLADKMGVELDPQDYQEARAIVESFEEREPEPDEDYYGGRTMLSRGQERQSENEYLEAMFGRLADR